MFVKLGSQHFSSRVREYLLSDRPSNVLDIYKVQSLVEHPAHRIASRDPGLCSY